MMLLYFGRNFGAGTVFYFSLSIAWSTGLYSVTPLNVSRENSEA